MCAKQVAELRQFAGDLAYCELADLAAHMGRQVQAGQPQPLRLAIVASTPADLEGALDEILRLAPSHQLAPGELAAEPLDLAGGKAVMLACASAGLRG